MAVSEEFGRGYAVGMAEERAAVVAWLRRQRVRAGDALDGTRLADAVGSGAHLGVGEEGG